MIGTSQWLCKVACSQSNLFFLRDFSDRRKQGQVEQVQISHRSDTPRNLGHSNHSSTYSLVELDFGACVVVMDGLEIFR